MFIELGATCCLVCGHLNKYMYMDMALLNQLELLHVALYHTVLHVHVLYTYILPLQCSVSPLASRSKLAVWSHQSSRSQRCAGRSQCPKEVGSGGCTHVFIVHMYIRMVLPLACAGTCIHVHCMRALHV